ncbi:GT2 family glycosyltransferase [Albidovulum inexpectatum]|uniref:GT2 family glycosyltransferase n=1 Tax=Albidovulum inexpectatum TaxID=196587 RepID=A0A2S5JDY5_9RHOB|nr:glycosyltransferase [Albidovulum inexpectatum]PPB79663.1 GT2 family glycosyltransferase [Albidovulum inexpectatum]
MNIAIIIPHYNDAARLRRCLDALAAQDLSGSEIVVVDNGSTQPLDDIAASFPQVRFVTEHGRGAAMARNRGVTETRAEHILFLDADCIPSPGWLNAARSAIGKADIVGGAIDVFDETPPPRSGAQAFETVFAFNYRRYVQKKHFSVTANLLTRRRVFDEIGPFRPGLSEDEEWCQRARGRGFSIALAEDMRVAHPTRSDWPALRRKWKRLTSEMFALNMTNHPEARGRLLWAGRALLMPVSILVHLPRILFSPRLNGWGERLRGAVTLARLRLLRMAWMTRQALTGRP